MVDEANQGGGQPFGTQVLIQMEANFSRLFERTDAINKTVEMLSNSLAELVDVTKKIGELEYEQRSNSESFERFDRKIEGIKADHEALEKAYSTLKERFNHHDTAQKTSIRIIHGGWGSVAVILIGLLSWVTPEFMAMRDQRLLLPQQIELLENKISNQETLAEILNILKDKAHD